LSTDLKFTKELVELRRAKCLELVAQAVPQNKIAEQLGVSPATVSLDLQYLRCTAQQKLKTHIEERIPAQFEVCQAGLKLLLGKMYDIINNKSSKPQEVLAATGVAVDIYGKLMDLNTNGAILEKTVKWLESKKSKTHQQVQVEEQQEMEQEQSEE
jgi:predicted transcriptional regulator